MKYISIIALLILAFSACDTNNPIFEDDQGEDDQSSTFLSPSMVLQQLDVCCRTSLQSVPFQINRPSYLHVDETGRYLLTDGRTLWRYEATGVLIFERRILNSEICEVSEYNRGFAFICLTEVGQRYITVKENGDIVKDIILDHVNVDPTNYYYLPDGGIILLRKGNSHHVDGMNGDIVRFSASGQNLWAQHYEDKVAEALSFFDYGDLLMVGSLREPDTLKAWVTRIGVDGMMRWEKKLTNCKFCELLSVTRPSSDYFLLAGERAAQINGFTTSAPWITLIDGSGNEVWNAKEPFGTAIGKLILARGGVQEINAIVGKSQGVLHKGVVNIRTLRIAQDAELLDQYNWPEDKWQEDECATVDLDANPNGEIVLLQNCERIEAMYPIRKGETWAKIVVIQ